MTLFLSKESTIQQIREKGGTFQAVSAHNVALGTELGNEALRVLSQMPEVVKIDFFGVSLRQFAAEALPPGLVELDLGRNGLEPESGAQLGLVLRDLTSLRSVSLFGNSLGEQGIMPILESLTGLANLNLGENNLKDLQGVSIRGIETLTLTRNALGDIGAESLAQGLDDQLEHLKIAHCQITTGGCVQLAPALGSLIELEIDGNPIRDAGLLSILEGCPRLTRLSCTDCGLSDPLVVSQFVVLRPIRQILFAKGNFFDKKGIELVAAAARTHPFWSDTLFGARKIYETVDPLEVKVLKKKPRASLALAAFCVAGLVEPARILVTRGVTWKIPKNATEIARSTLFEAGQG